jgi:hypothetical protein
MPDLVRTAFQIPFHCVHRFQDKDLIGAPQSDYFHTALIKLVENDLSD